MVGARYSTPADLQSTRRLVGTLQRRVGEARLDLAFKLREAAPQVREHSRVVDLQRSLDSLEAMLSEISRHLEPRNNSDVATS